ncbi:hypothetical protein Desti_1476 [Desulfomonile tiedjei DSM 6799]|uniref:Uncharacterized protein n=1 Tax=Desulfomonile tiedjei (strain ATCC 49306 / DSM 6799 / DCB-1) TaxID=706587 RepID=I4C3P7_DESTA|nr:hypothetical protein Desti_1476 [Desulfomonile tiedjei DSM 6799]
MQKSESRLSQGSRLERRCDTVSGRNSDSSCLLLPHLHCSELQRAFKTLLYVFAFPDGKHVAFFLNKELCMLTGFKGSMRSSRFLLPANGLHSPSGLKALSESGTFSTSSAVNTRMYSSDRLIGYISSRRSYFRRLQSNISKHEWIGYRLFRANRFARTDAHTTKHPRREYLCGTHPPFHSLYIPNAKDYQSPQDAVQCREQILVSRSSAVRHIHHYE